MDGVASRKSPVRDPVCGMDIEPSEAIATRAVDGETLYFCSERCVRQFHRERVNSAATGVSTDRTSRAKAILRSRTGLALLAFLAIAAFYLVTEHTAHVFGVAPYLLLLLCPLLHLFHGGHGGGHSGHHGGDSAGSPPRGPR